MVEISDKSKDTLQELILIQKGKGSKQDIKSRKKIGERESRTLLTAQKIPHGTKCYECGLNCTIKHAESNDFWAIKEGIAPIYTRETCPKQGHLEKYGIDMKRKKSRRK